MIKTLRDKIKDIIIDDGGDGSDFAVNAIFEAFEGRGYGESK